jgi:hypothetical protein
MKEKLCLPVVWRRLPNQPRWTDDAKVPAKTGAKSAKGRPSLDHFKAILRHMTA